MLLVVAEPETVGSERLPRDGERQRVEPVVELPGVDAERAQVVAEHQVVAPVLEELAACPDPGRVGGPEELVGDQPVVDREPLRKVAEGRARAGQRRDAAAEAEVLGELVLQEARHDDLRALALARVGAPHVEQVAQPRVHHPAEGVELHLLELDVLPKVQLVRPSERVGVLVVEPLLVQVAHVGVELEVERSPGLLRDPQAPELWLAGGLRNVRGRGVLVLEDAHAVGHPLERLRLPADQLVLGLEPVAELRHVVRRGAVDGGEEPHSEGHQADCAAQANPSGPGIPQRSASSRRRQSTPRRRRPERREKPIRN